MNNLLLAYETFIRRRLHHSTESDERDLRYWQNQLFCSFLVYCLPISLIAVLPGVYIAVKDGAVIIATVDVFCFTLVALATFWPMLALRNRKILVVGVFYFLAVFLVNTLGYFGPGVFYLFFITVLAALIFPVRYAYLSVLVNILVLLLFALIINFKFYPSALVNQYTVGKWIAFSANLIFASLIVVLLIDKIFKGLQLTISNKTNLQERYQLIFDRSPLPMWLFDTDTFIFLDVNEAAIRHYGYTKAEFLSMTIMDIRYSEDIPQTKEVVKANTLSGEFFGGTSQHLKKNGDAIYVKVESNLLLLDKRSVRLVLATDITTQVEHQLEVFNVNLRVKESEANLRAIFDSAIDGFVLLDGKGCIKLFNDKALNAMRFNKGRAPFEIGRSIFDFIEPPRLSYFKEIIKKVYTGETVDYDRMFRDNGQISWIRYTLTPVKDGQNIAGVCITGRDVTARKLYLRSVEEQNRVFREISWVQSHLVRAPLARIMGLVPLVSQEIDEAERSKILEYLNISVAELDSVIKEITQKSTNIIDKYPHLGEME